LIASLTQGVPTIEEQIYYLTNKKTSVSEVLYIGVSASSSFLMLDIFAPSVGSATRTGAGMGIGRIPPPPLHLLLQGFESNTDTADPC